MLFDTVDHNILIQKLNHYDITVANNWFSSYLQNRLYYVSINGFNLKLEQTHCGVPQGSILEPLLFLIYINDLKCAIRYCSVHHSADETHLLNNNNSEKISGSSRSSFDLSCADELSKSETAAACRLILYNAPYIC